MSELVLHVLAADGSTTTQADTLTLQLMSDIRAIRSFAVRSALDTPTDSGKSGTAQQIGTLIVSGLFSAATIRALRDVLIAYIDRTKARGVQIRTGDTEVTITGASRADLSDIARQLGAAQDGDEAETKKAT